MIHFKYHPVNEQGQVTGFLRTKGTVDAENLTLGKETLPTACVLQVVQRQKRLILIVNSGGEVRPRAIQIVSGDAREIKRTMDRAGSANYAEHRRSELAAAGQGHQFRAIECPNCQATIDLSGLKSTPEMYCPYCETIAFQDPTTPKMKDQFRLCDQCGYYSDPRQFTSFYFVFLFVFYYFQHQTTTRCHSCMRGEAWKMTLGNAVFVIGLPFALWQLARSYFASHLRSHFRELDAANGAAKAGDVEKADRLYRLLLERAPQTAGIHYNRALAYAAANDWETAVAAAREALLDCANYHPAANILAEGLKAQGLPTNDDELARRLGKFDDEASTHIKEM